LVVMDEIPLPALITLPDPAAIRRTNRLYYMPNSL
jgi:hypothetical protein